MILLIDNYDSFVHNLARYINKMGLEPKVMRNDKITIEEITTLSPIAIIISAGPKAPQDAGICINLIKELGSTTPILGVCLGHQAIAEAYGGKTMRSQKPTHGKSSTINHDGSDIFQNIPSPMQAGRYHSLTSDIPNSSGLIVNARSKSGEVMAIYHKIHPVFGVQFHPESVLTPDGMAIIENFITKAKDWNLKNKKVNT